VTDIGGRFERGRNRVGCARALTGAEHCGCALDVRAPAAIRLLVVQKVLGHCALARLGQRAVLVRLCGVNATHQAGHEEHGPAVVPREVPVLALQHLVEGECAVASVSRRAARCTLRVCQCFKKIK
jgi:hypothetical protein